MSMHQSNACCSVKNRLIDLLKTHQFDSALPLLSAMKETWPSDAVFSAAAVTDDASDDSSLSTDEELTSDVANLLGSLQRIFLGEYSIFRLCHVTAVQEVGNMSARPVNIHFSIPVSRHALMLTNFSQALLSLILSNV